MADRIKFYMDEHVARAITEGLRRRGVEVLTAQEAGLQEADDDKHVALAFADNRVISPRMRTFCAYMRLVSRIGESSTPRSKQRSDTSCAV